MPWFYNVTSERLINTGDTPDCQLFEYGAGELQELSGEDRLDNLREFYREMPAELIRPRPHSLFTLFYPAVYRRRRIRRPADIREESAKRTAQPARFVGSLVSACALLFLVRSKAEYTGSFLLLLPLHCASFSESALSLSGYGRRDW